MLESPGVPGVPVRSTTAFQHGLRQKLMVAAEAAMAFRKCTSERPCFLGKCKDGWMDG